MKRIGLLMIHLAFVACLFSQGIERSGRNIAERFSPPAGFERVAYPEGSFAQYLRQYPLKPFGAPVLLYDGRVKQNDVHLSVFDMPLLDEDLIQCADAIMKLRAEYLFAQKRYGDLRFTITNGMRVPFQKYVEGYRLVVKGNSATWKGDFRKGASRSTFNEYMRFIYAFAGTRSMAQESKPRKIGDIQVGDYFIVGGSPGHAVLVLDLAREKATGKTIMLLGQSYMPSQEFHVLKSYASISPWYPVEDADLATPEWSFPQGSLKYFP